MSSAGSTRRPLGVTLVVWLVVVGAVLLGVLSWAVFTSRVQPDVGADRALGLLVLGYVFGVLAALLLAVAVLLHRGVNVGRLVLTLAIGVQQTNAWVLVLQFGGDVVQGVVGLLISSIMLLLVWNGSANAFFERPEDEALGRTVSSSRRSSRLGSGALLFDYLIRLVVLALTLAVSPGITVSGDAPLALAVIAIALAGWLLRPLFVRVAGVLGWFGAVLLALFANAAVIGLGLYLVPGIEVDGFLTVVLASWIYGLVMAAVTWVFSINSQDYLTVHAVRMSSRESGDHHGPREPGVVVVQLDGVPAPLLENEIRAGNLPTISRWIRSGSHTWTEWVARVPSTTPVSQAGLLHGTNEGIPAFRWFDRELGRMLVANRPADAALIESRLSDGRGLLADDGVSISNLFSGDAGTSLLTMSGIRQRSSGLGPSSSYAAFFTHPAGFTRALIMTIGEMVKEVFQARRQERRDVVPRIHRGGSYVALRAVTNVFLRDLNVALVVEAMMQGAKTIYVDFVDYDEIAHHAGVSRPESLASLYGLDEVLGSLETVQTSGVSGRDYHFVLVSDHGQSQGSTFAQRYGQSLEAFVREHLGGTASVAASTAEVEAYGPVNVLLNQLAGQASVTGRITKRALAERDPQNPLGPDDADTSAGGMTGPDDSTVERPDLVVVGSGNLGGIWFAQEPQRQTLDEIEAQHPGLVAALAEHPGVGFLVVMTAAGPVAVGRAGTHDLETAQVNGEDPLAGFPPQTAVDFARAALFATAPDIYVNSLYDPVLDEVAAFEELVGCHGGVGGWQTRPLLVHPTAWPVDADLLSDDGRLHGADVVHRQLVRWLEALGLRSGLASRPEPEAVAVPTDPTGSGG